MVGSNKYNEPMSLLFGENQMALNFDHIILNPTLMYNYQCFDLKKKLITVGTYIYLINIGKNIQNQFNIIYHYNFKY